MADLLAQLKHLAEMEPNWNGYGEHEITLDAINRCKGIHFSPLPNGGIQIELTDGVHDVEVVVLPTGAIGGVSMDRDWRSGSPAETGEDDTDG